MMVLAICKVLLSAYPILNGLVLILFGSIQFIPHQMSTMVMTLLIFKTLRQSMGHYLISKC